LLAAGLVVLAAGACEDEKTPEDTTAGEPTKITVEQIIVQPKVAAPEDTMLFTAVVTSSSQNEGDIPAMDWTATGGTFVEDDELTVRWIAPSTPGVFAVTAKATNAANSSTATADVFIGTSQTILTTNAGEIHLIGAGPDFRYLFTADLTRGVDVYSVVGFANQGDAIVPQVANNLTVEFAPNGAFEVHAADSAISGNPPPRHVYIGTFATGQRRGLTRDRSVPGQPKHHQFSFPAVSPNSELIAYQGLLQDPAGAYVDSFHVFVFDLVANQTVKVTALHEAPRHFFPTFSTDGQWLTYVSDPTGRERWELYAAPVSGNVVDGSLASRKQLTSTGGTIASGLPTDVKNPLKTWNPVTPVLAIRAADGALYLVQMTATGATVTDVAGVSGVQELVWSPTGNLLAASRGGRIVTITLAGTATDLVVGVSGDILRDIAWSPDGEWMVYRVTRGASSWFELLDVDAGVLTAPLPITAATPPGAVAAYRESMSMSPAWTGGDLVICPVFGVGSTATPGVVYLDLSGVTD
jgi:hypothetical protein